MSFQKRARQTDLRGILPPDLWSRRLNSFAKGWEGTIKLTCCP
jgi:hypothetical protein